MNELNIITVIITKQRNQAIAIEPKTIFKNANENPFLTGERIKEISKEIETIQKEFEKNFQEMVADPINEMVKVLDPNHKGIKIKFIDPAERYKYQMEKGNFAEFDAKTDTIYFDHSKYDSGYGVHEYTHALLKVMFKANPHIERAFTDNLRKMFSDYDFQIVKTKDGSWAVMTGKEMEAWIIKEYGVTKDIKEKKGDHLRNSVDVLDDLDNLF